MTDITATDALAAPDVHTDLYDPSSDLARMLPGSSIYVSSGEDGLTHAVFVDRVMVAAYTDDYFDLNERNAEAYRDKLIAQRDRIAGELHRASLIAGIRDLADFLEQHPDVPAPGVSGYGYEWETTAEGFRHAVEAMRPLGGSVAEDKISGRDGLLIKVDFGPVKLQYQVLADKVCETEPVTVMRPVIPAWARDDDQPVAEAA